MNCVYIIFSQIDAKRGLTWRHADDKTAEFCTHELNHITMVTFTNANILFWTHILSCRFSTLFTSAWTHSWKFLTRNGTPVVDIGFIWWWLYWFACIVLQLNFAWLKLSVLSVWLVEVWDTDILNAGVMVHGTVALLCMREICMDMSYLYVQYNTCTSISHRAWKIVTEHAANIYKG